MKRKANVPIFIPHVGCPHDCSFCDQRAISGRQHPPTAEDVRAILTDARQTLRQRGSAAEIAFFGGSFTVIEPRYRRDLLKAAGDFLDGDVFTGIRISTRPDAIDQAILDELERSGVTAIELGAQSMDDEVLRLSGRGHSSAQTASAARLIRDQGFSLGLQRMTGLPGDTDEKAVATAKKLAELKPDTIRIYPALILQGSELERQYQRGVYRPQALEEAVALCAHLLRYFNGQGIRVIRLGLHQEAEMQARIIAGPYHPAFRELVEGEILLGQAVSAIRASSIPPGPIRILVAPGSQGKMAGQNRRNIKALTALGYPPRISAAKQLKYLQLAIDPRTEE